MSLKFKVGSKSSKQYFAQKNVSTEWVKQDTVQIYKLSTGEIFVEISDNLIKQLLDVAPTSSVFYKRIIKSGKELSHMEELTNDNFMSPFNRPQTPIRCKYPYCYQNARCPYVHSAKQAYCLHYLLGGCTDFQSDCQRAPCTLYHGTQEEAAEILKTMLNNKETFIEYAAPIYEKIKTGNIRYLISDELEIHSLDDPPLYELEYDEVEINTNWADAMNC